MGICEKVDAEMDNERWHGEDSKGFDVETGGATWVEGPEVNKGGLGDENLMNKKSKIRILDAYFFRQD